MTIAVYFDKIQLAIKRFTYEPFAKAGMEK